MTFENPSNGYQESVSYLTWLWCFIFGALYFAYKGIWRHFVLYLAAIPCSFGTSIFIYPFFARSIVINNYLRKGWVRYIPAKQQ